MTSQSCAQLRFPTTVAVLETYATCDLPRMDALQKGCRQGCIGILSREDYGELMEGMLVMLDDTWGKLPI